MFYAQSESPITATDTPAPPPLVIWGPGDPRPTLPIAGWKPDGSWGDPPKPDQGLPPTEELPPSIWGPNDPRPTVPIAEPPWGWGGTPPQLPTMPGFKPVVIWSPATGWAVIGIPTNPIPTPSKGRR